MRIPPLAAGAEGIAVSSAVAARPPPGGSSGRGLCPAAAGARRGWSGAGTAPAPAVVGLRGSPCPEEAGVRVGCSVSGMCVCFHLVTMGWFCVQEIE